MLDGQRVSGEGRQEVIPSFRQSCGHTTLIQAELNILKNKSHEVVVNLNIVISGTKEIKNYLSIIIIHQRHTCTHEESRG